MKNKLNKTDEEWREILNPDQYKILRKGKTERAFTGPNWDTKEPGLYTCAGCGQELFSSEAKFDSGTGWPSFDKPVNSEAVGEKEDRSLFTKRTEVHCSKCEGHLGHVFPDGPKETTGQRYCINGYSLNFKPADQQ